jgi:hypothetical protein
MERYNTRTLFFLYGGLFFWPACSPQLVPLIFFFLSGDIPDVYPSPLRDFSRARELENYHLLTIQSACDTHLVFSTEYDSQLCVAVCCAMKSLVVALNSYLL